MPWTAGGSLRRVLTGSTMAAVTAALLVCAGALVAEGVLTFRRQIVRSLQTQAELMARQCTSALVFHDPEAASTTLSALASNPNVLSATLFDAGGSVFAEYRRAGTPPEAPPAPEPGVSTHRFAGGRLAVQRAVEDDGRRIGTVVITSGLEELGRNLRRYALIVAVVLLGSFGLAYATASRLQRAIREPVLHLAATAQAVSSGGDYSVRAGAASAAAAELGLLVSTFNHMLEQIQQRDAALEGARQDLERQVDERTADLRREVRERQALAEELRSKNEELERQSARVQEATRLKSEFLANMSHELRTPLNAIIGFAELVHDGRVGEVSADQKECLADILTSSRHLLQLINDVLDLSKVEAGRMEFQAERFALARVVAEVRDILRTLSARKRITVAAEFDPALDEVVLDPGKLKQVLYNYLSNALKFTPAGGRVVVRTRAEGPQSFRLEVEDTGPGIRPEDLPRLFVEFQQLEAGTAKTHQGTGLGLALTRRIVEAQGGRTGVESTVGRGSTFYAVLPRASTPGERTPTAAAEPMPPSGTTILVVEDDPRDRAWLRDTLAAGGYAVEEATSLRQALERCAERRYAGITLDLFLPDGTGWDLLKQIRQGGPNAHTPVVVVTVVAEEHAGAAFAIHDYLVKPVQEQQLLDSLRAAGVQPLGSAPIVVVDDDAQARRLVETTLRGVGFQALGAASGPEGLALLEERAASAVILDLLMPGMDGFEFLDRFRSTPRGRTTPVIVWTASDLSGRDHQRLAASAQGVVLKRRGGAGPLIDELRQHVALAGSHGR